MKYFVDYLPVTTDNDPKLYLDGKDYCADLAASIRGARRFVLLTGLHFMADFRLVRTGTPDDAKHTLVGILADAAARGVRIYLLVNQFWVNEQEVSESNFFDSPIRRKIMTDGELHGYLPETFRLFHLLSGFQNVHCRTDIHTNSDTFGTNHQKTVVVDDRIAYLGGIDLTYLDGDRWDTGDHRAKNRAVDRTQKYWHDVHMRITGPAVKYVRDNFVQRWEFGDLHTLRTGAGNKRSVGTTKYVSMPLKYQHLMTREEAHPALPLFAPTGAAQALDPKNLETGDAARIQIVRSMPHKDNWPQEKPKWNTGSDRFERSCKEAYLIGIEAAEKYIYLENQWVADEDIWEALAAAAKRNKKNPDFRIILMVPYEGLFAAGLGSNQELWIGDEMEEVIDSSRDDGTFGMYSLHSVRRQGEPYAQIYVHSKIMIVDDKWALIGSANAGGISLEGVRGGADEPDTELSAIILDPQFASNFRKSLWEEHLRKRVKASYDVHDADQFRRLAGHSGSKVRFFPKYDKIKRGVATWRRTPRPKTISIKQFRPQSRIVPSFSLDVLDALPPTLITAAFRTHIVPSPPPGYRVWYRWRCDVLDQRSHSTGVDKARFRLWMRSLKYDRDDVRDYSDQDTAYIGKKSAEFIDRNVKDVAPGVILCRVQIIPLDEAPDERNSKFPSILFKQRVTFMNERFAVANRPDILPWLGELYIGLGGG